MKYITKYKSIIILRPGRREPAQFSLVWWSNQANKGALFANTTPIVLHMFNHLTKACVFGYCGWASSQQASVEPAVSHKAIAVHSGWVFNVKSMSVALLRNKTSPPMSYGCQAPCLDLWVTSNRTVTLKNGKSAYKWMHYCCHKKEKEKKKKPPVHYINWNHLSTAGGGSSQPGVEQW